MRNIREINEPVGSKNAFMLSTAIIIVLVIVAGLANGINNYYDTNIGSIFAGIIFAVIALWFYKTKLTKYVYELKNKCLFIYQKTGKREKVLFKITRENIVSIDKAKKAKRLYHGRVQATTITINIDGKKINIAVALSRDLKDKVTSRILNEDKSENTTD